MPLTLRLALGNAGRCARDYSVYLVTLALASCLLYSFDASGDYLLATGLAPDQLAVVERARGVTGAFSTFVVLVFAVLVAYASRFITRRRSREFGTYALLGMRAPALAGVIVAEGALVGALALAAGLVLGVLASPAYGVVAAFVFDVPWRLAWSASPTAALGTCAWFALVEGAGVALSVVDVLRRPLVELVAHDRAPERLALMGRGPARAQAALAAGLLAVVWGSCVAQPGLFVLAVLPMGWAAYAATALVLRLVAGGAAARLRRSRGYWEGLRAFVLRQLEGHVSTGCQALSCACVLMASAACMICAGLAFTVGERAVDPAAARGLAPIGYVGIFYGESFLLSAAAVLALQQLSQAADGRRAYGALAELGAEPREMRDAVAAQVGASFALPAAMAVAHDAFGLALVRRLVMDVPDGLFLAVASGSLAAVLALLGAYYLLCVRECRRMLLGGGTGRDAGPRAGGARPR